MNSNTTIPKELICPKCGHEKTSLYDIDYRGEIRQCDACKCKYVIKYKLVVNGIKILER